MINRHLPPPIHTVGDFTLKKPLTYRLNNGVKVFSTAVGTQDILQLQLILEAGKVHELKKGVAGLVGRMLLEGTKSKSSAQLHQAFDRCGVFKEIAVGFDHTTIELLFLSRFLEPVCALLCEIMTEAAFPENDLQNVKRILVQQLAVNEKRGQYISGTAFRACLFGENSAYGYTTTEKIIAQIDQKDLADFYQNHYKAKNFVILLSGKVAPQHLKIIENTIGKLPVNSTLKPRKPTEISAFIPKKHHLTQKNSLQTSIKIGKPLPPWQHPDRIAVEVTNELLGGYAGSQLMKNLRENKGLTYGIYAGIFNLKPLSYLLISTEVKKEKTAIVLQEIYAEIENLQHTKISEQALHELIYYMSSSFIQQMNTPIAVSEYLKTIYLHQLPPDFFDTYLSKVRQITPQDIQETAQKHFSLPMLEVTVG